MYQINMIYTIKTLLNKGFSQRRIAKELGINRKTVKKYCEQISEGKIEEPKINRSKVLDNHRVLIVEWLEKGLTAQLIFDKLVELHKINISYPTVARFIGEIKSKSEVYVPMISHPADEAQVDYGYLGLFEKDGKKIKVWCFVITLSFSRLKYVEAVTSQTVQSFLTSHIHAFEYFGGVPKTVKIDNLKAGVIFPSFYEPKIQTQYADFLQYYDSMPITARVRRPQDKGKVEASVKFVKNNFLKNLEHSDFFRMQNELKIWVEKVNNRQHGTTKKVPLEQYNLIEKQELKPLPSARFEIYFVAKRKANNYAHVVFENNYYSVPAKFAGQELWLHYNENILKIFDNQTQIAIHAISKKSGEYITQEHHKPIEKQYKNKEFYLEKSKKIGEQVFLFSLAVCEKQPYDYMRVINGLCFLAKKHGNDIVDAACKRSLLYNAISYTSIKNICEKK